MAARLYQSLLVVSERPNRTARVFAFVLVHFCSSVTLAKVERAIIEEVLDRAKHARENQPSRAQWIPRFWTRFRVRKATKKLYRTMDSFRFNR